MSGLLDRFPRTRKGRPCPVCGHVGWCLLETERDGEPLGAICPRVESPHPWGKAGYYHELRPGAWRSRPRAPRQITLEPRRTYGKVIDEMERGLEPDRLH